jgi:hypothetical protein
MADDTNPPSGKRAAVRKNAQDHFAATARRDTEVRKELERQQATAAAKIAKLRALRLAKEEEDRLAAASAPPRPAAARKVKRIKV